MGQYVSTDRQTGWINILSDAGKTLVQVDKDEVQKGTDGNKRIVFARFDGSEDYEFIGVLLAPN